ncbi:extracellular solute-binding protein [Paenibacillus lignilyticus]|uniref:Extracellular solute-binding protein n=1 Tax=Paenibacillus lignilyticus TaxID=1172615 RepID=A0ABS5CI83_9BACL|nr:extracellular solute-binding protein [Paenibacillus lignilyticus]
MNNKVKAAASISLIAALMLTSAACGNSNNTSENGNTAAANNAAATNESGTNNAAAENTAPAEKPDPFAKMDELVEFTTGISISAEAKPPAGESFENNDVQKWFEENLNVKPKMAWSTSDQNFAFEQKVSLLIAANNIPDVLSISVDPNGLSILKKLIKADMIEDLSKVYEDYASPFLKESIALGGPDALNAVSSDGKLYAIPSIADVETAIPVIWTRKDWLDQVGLPEPKTLDDVETALKAFKDKFGAGVLPAQQNIYGADTNSFDFVFGAYNSYPGQWVKTADGSVGYGSVQPEMKGALERLAKWYKEGMIAPDFIMNDSNKSVEMIAKGKAGVFQGAWWSTWYPLPDSIKNDHNANWQATVLQGVDGVAHAKGYGAVRSFVVVKKGFSHPEAIMKMLNYAQEANTKHLDWYNKLTIDEGAKYLNAKMPLLPVGVSAKDPHEITVRYKAIQDVLNGTTPMDKADPESKAQATAIQNYEKATDKFADMGLWSLANQFAVGAAGLVKNPVQQTLPAFIGSTDLMQKKKASMDDLEKKTFLEIITGKKSIDEFDSFVKLWNDMGGKDITAEVNDIVGK